MRSTFVKSTAAGLAILTGTLGVAALGTGIAGAQDNGTNQRPAAGQDAQGNRQAMRRHLAKAVVKDASETIGISTGDLVSSLRQGQSIAQVAEAHGVDPQAVIDSLVAKASTRIDQAVSEGKISAEKGAELKAKLPERVTNLVNRTFDGNRGNHQQGN